MPISTDFFYIIAIKDNLEPVYSPFQGFCPGSLDLPQFLGVIAHLPANLLELCSDREKAISLRMSSSSGYRILPIELRFLSAIEISPNKPFLCFFSNKDGHMAVQQLVKRYEQPILHVSIKRTKSSIPLGKLDRETLFDYSESVIAYLRSHATKEAMIMLDKYFQRPPKWKPIRTPLKQRNHLVTLPNETVLSSFGYKFHGTEHLLASASDEPYINAVMDSAGAINEERNRVASSDVKFYYPPSMTVILTAPSLYRTLYRTRISAKRFSGIDDAKNLARGLGLISKQKSFSFLIQPDQFLELLDSDIWKFLVDIRKRETLTYTAAVAIKACENFVPVLRLSPSINLLHPNLEKLGSCARGHSQNKESKMDRIFGRVCEQLEEIVPENYRKLIDRTNNYIKLMCDAPLEWMRIRDLPLFLRFDTSRIPTTPGNLFLQQSIHTNQLIMSAKDFEEVLIIRSFKADDPLRNILRDAIRTVQEQRDLSRLRRALDKNEKTQHISTILERSMKDRGRSAAFQIRIRWEDVSSEEQLVQALENFDGALMVFDGHGVHEKGKDIGSLAVGNEQIDIWQLKRQLRIPPIVLLSACDTHPLDRSHASTANGFLLAGAVTVLATVLPISGLSAGLFIARLILRLQEFLPILLRQFGQFVRWTRVVSGLQRMSYVTETMEILRYRCGVSISDDSWLRISVLCNNSINANDPVWYEKMIEYISLETGKNTNEIRQLVGKSRQITDSIKYTQLGNPDKILLASEAFANRMFEVGNQM